jgi:hypothetical protein
MKDALPQASLGALVTGEAVDTTEGSEIEPVAGKPPTLPTNIDRDETISTTSEESDGNMSIPHGDLYDETDQGISFHQEQEYDENTETQSVAMPPAIQALLNAWYAVHGRGTLPCATSTIPEFLYSRNVSGETAYFVHRSGEHLKVRMYPLSDGQISKTAQSKQRIIVAQGPTQGPFIIKYASQKNGRMTGTSYKIWRGVNGGDKDGFEVKPSVHKRYKSTGTEPPKPTKHVKKVPPKKAGSRGNQLYAADSMAKAHTNSKSRPNAAAENGSTRRSSYEFRPSKRLKQDEESPANYSKLLAAFSSSAEPTSSRKQGEQSSHRGMQQESRPMESDQVIEHMQNNAVFLFYPKTSPQPRARLFRVCSTMQKLFAQALAGEVFDEDTTAAKVLSVRVAGQQKAKAVVEDDEQDFEDVVEALKEAPCWVTTNTGISGSCTVEVRAK